MRPIIEVLGSEQEDASRDCRQPSRLGTTIR